MRIESDTIVSLGGRRSALTSVPALPETLEVLGLEELTELDDVDAVTRCPRLRQVMLGKLSATVLARVFTALAQCPALVELTLSNIEDLPPQVKKLRSLTTLTLSDCTFPVSAYAHLGKLPLLREVEVYDRERSRPYPDGLAALTQVTQLSLQFYKKLVPASVTKMRSLEVLDLDRNRLTELPANIGALTKLRQLIVSGSPVKELPASLRKCTALETLDLHDTRVSTLPPWIGELENLSTLQLSYTRVKELPASIGSLSALRTLSLPETVQAVPPGLELYELRGTKAQKAQVTLLPLPPPQDDTVFLHEADRIPADLGQPLVLKIDTQLTAPLRQLARLTRLTELWIDGTDLDLVLPHATKIPTLTTIVTEAATIPSSITKLAHLEELRMLHVESLPPLAKLKRLRRLAMSCTLRDADALDGLPALQNLHLIAEELTRFTPRLPALTELKLDDVKLKRMPELRCPKLTSVTVSWLYGTREFALDSLGDVPTLRSLTLGKISNLDLSWLPDELTALKLFSCDLASTQRISELAQLTTLRIDRAPDLDLTGCTSLRNVTMDELPKDFKARLPPGRWRKLDRQTYVRSL